jgi:hypothetical protein
MEAIGLRITLLDAWAHYSAVTDIAPGWRKKLDAMFDSDKLIAPLVHFPVQAITREHLKILFIRLASREGSELAKTKVRTLDNLIEAAFMHYNLPGKPASWRSPRYLSDGKHEASCSIGKLLANLYKNGSPDEIRRYARLTTDLASGDAQTCAAAYRELHDEVRS